MTFRSGSTPLSGLKLVGGFGDHVTTPGAIIGRMSMSVRNDMIFNKEARTATGSAANTGDGDDTVEVCAGTPVVGLIDGGAGNDTLKLTGTGVGVLGANVNFENLVVQSGVWTLQSDAYDVVTISSGATVMSQLKLANEGMMTVAAGGGVIAIGNNAVVAEGSADIENSGIIQGLGMAEMLPAAAIVLNGGEVHNKAGGIILAQGVAIVSGAVATAGVAITNEGLIQGLSGQAIKLVGDQDDTVTNKSAINGSVDLGAGDDALVVHIGSSISGAVTGGDGIDTVELVGATPSSVGSFNGSGASGFEKLAVAEGAWSVTGSELYSDITIEDGATVTSPLNRDGADTLVIEAGGKLTGTLVVQNDQTSVALDNAGTIDKVAYGSAINLYLGEADSTVTLWNRETGVIKATNADGTGSAGLIYVSGGGEMKLEFNNAGLLETSARVFQANDFGGESFVLNNLANGVIRSSSTSEAVLRGNITTVNNAGTIEGGRDGFDARSFSVTFNNLAGGSIEAGRHAVTGEGAVRVTNAAGGTMVGLNGSAVNLDNNSSEAEKAFITNFGTMEGRSAETSDSDGDAIDVDGLAQILNYGRIAGLGAEGYHNGEPNVSEGIAFGGGTVVNSAAAEIYGYGRAIQVDDSSNGSAFAATTIVNDGLIQGDGNGPEGVAAADAARFDLRGNEAINLVGDYEDFVGNNSTGRIVGGVSMGGARDTLNNSGAIIATGGSAIDMGAGNDQVNLYVGATVAGTILLGDGDDVALATSASDFVIEGGDGSDTMAMDAGDDILSGGAGNDFIYGGAGEDRIDGGLDNDTLYGNAGDDLIEGGAGDDFIDGGNDDDVIFGDAGNDTIIAGLGNDTVKGNAGDDVFVITAASDGRDSYDGGDGIDTLDFSALATSVNLTLRDGVTTYATDTIENVENVLGGSAADRLTGNSLANTLTGNAGDDILRGLAGGDKLDGGFGDDDLDGGADNDTLSGGFGNDVLKGGAGDDVIQGGAGNDTLTGGAGLDRFVFNSMSDGIDTITDFRVSGTSMDQLVLSASMFQGFSGDDAFDLIGSGFLRSVTSGGSSQIQIDINGGGDSFQTLALLTGNFSNGQIADHTIVVQDPVA